LGKVIRRCPTGEKGRKDKTMTEIKYYVHGNSPYIYPHYMMLPELPAELAEMRRIAWNEMVATGTAHAVYAVKRYAEGGEIDRVDFYNPRCA
jgi:hypothetical protein